MFLSDKRSLEKAKTEKSTSNKPTRPEKRQNKATPDGFLQSYAHIYPISSMAVFANVKPFSRASVRYSLAFKEFCFT